MYDQQNQQNQSTSLPTRQPVYSQVTSLPAKQPVYQPGNQSTSLPARQPVYQSGNQSTRPVYQVVQNLFKSYIDYNQWVTLRINQSVTLRKIIELPKSITWLFNCNLKDCCE